MRGATDFGFLLSINHSVVLARDRDGSGLGVSQLHSFRARLKGGLGAAVSEKAAAHGADSVERMAPLGGSMTVENAKRIRAMSGGHLPSIWRRLGIRSEE